MLNKHTNELDIQSVQEFLDDFLEKQEEIEQCLVSLESIPDNPETKKEIFNSVALLAEKCEFLKLRDAQHFTIAIMELLQAFADGRIHLSSQLSEVIMLCMDRLRLVIRHHIEEDTHESPEQTQKIQQQLITLTQLTPSEQYPALQYTLSLLSSNFETLDLGFDFSFGSEDVDSEVSSAMERDLDLFLNLMHQMEQRSIFWQGRGERCLSLSMEMNAASGNQVSPYALTAAIYLHDVGMGFLPEFLISKTTPLDEQEQNILHQHPLIASQLADRMSGWEETRDIVLQHHEQENGKGYPQGLKGDEICEGAKLLAVADAFISMTRPRADRMHKRSVVLAIMEINKFKGEQFSTHWVNVLNTVIRQRYLDNAG